MGEKKLFPFCYVLYLSSENRQGNISSDVQTVGKEKIG